MERIENLLNGSKWTDREGRILNPFKDMDIAYIENVERFIVNKILPVYIASMQKCYMMSGPAAHTHAADAFLQEQDYWFDATPEEVFEDYRLYRVLQLAKKWHVHQEEKRYKKLLKGGNGFAEVWR